MPIDYYKVVYGCIGWPWLWVNLILAYFWARSIVVCVKSVYFGTPWWCEKGGVQMVWKGYDEEIVQKRIKGI